MKTLETERLILRKFMLDDFPDVHSYASVPRTPFTWFGGQTQRSRARRLSAWLYQKQKKIHVQIINMPLF